MPPYSIIQQSAHSVISQKSLLNYGNWNFLKYYWSVQFPLTCSIYFYIVFIILVLSSLFPCMVWSATLMECVIIDFLVGIFASFKHAPCVEYNTRLIVRHISLIYILIDCLNRTPLWWCFTRSVCIMIFYSNQLWISNFTHYSFGKMYDYLHQYNLQYTHTVAIPNYDFEYSNDILYNFVPKHISCSIVLVQGAVLNFENYYILKLTTHENTGILSAFWQQNRNAYWIYDVDIVLSRC